MITTQLAHSLRAIHAAARPCGSAEDGRTVMAIHATPQRLADLLHAAQQLLDLQQAVSHEADQMPSNGITSITRHVLAW